MCKVKATLALTLIFGRIRERSKIIRSLFEYVNNPLHDIVDYKAFVLLTLYNDAHNTHYDIG
jgi:hypothetical protein